MQRRILLSLSFILLATTGCETVFEPPTPRPDYTIKVTPSADGKGYVAVPPECAPPTGPGINPFDNQAMPQFGCATARNLALMVADPQDLVDPKALVPADGTTEAAAMHRYQAGKTRPFIDPTKKETTTILTGLNNPGAGSDK